MSALRDLVYGKGQGPWPFFTYKFPVKVKQVSGLDNTLLKRDIEEAGDYLQGRTPAKCLMTRWDMHDHYESFRMVKLSYSNDVFEVSYEGLEFGFKIVNMYFYFVIPPKQRSKLWASLSSPGFHFDL